MMADSGNSGGARVLDPIDRISEILFGLFMVLTFTGTLSVASAGREEIRSMLVETGEPWGDTAMARTVSLPAAIATRLILKGGITVRGVQIPIWREIYEPVLEELADRGIRMKEQHIKSFHGPFDR